MAFESHVGKAVLPNTHTYTNLTLPHRRQDPETGGFTDRPGDMVDLYHTLFGLAGLSLLGETGLKEVNPVFCMPQYIMNRLGITVQIVAA